MPVPLCNLVTPYSVVYIFVYDTMYLMQVYTQYTCVRSTWDASRIDVKPVRTSCFVIKMQQKTETTLPCVPPFFCPTSISFSSLRISDFFLVAAHPHTFTAAVHPSLFVNSAALFRSLSTAVPGTCYNPVPTYNKHCYIKHQYKCSL